MRAGRAPRRPRMLWAGLLLWAALLAGCIAAAQAVPGSGRAWPADDDALPNSKGAATAGRVRVRTRHRRSHATDKLREPDGALATPPEHAGHVKVEHGRPGTGPLARALANSSSSSSSLILVTGCAGFIGMHVSLALLARGDSVVCADNISSYYDPALKRARLARLLAHGAFAFAKVDVTDRQAVRSLIASHQPDGIIHLAAQAGVRHSLTHPEDYIDNNLVGFGNVLEAARHASSVKHLVYASSSSVYGGNVKIPFSEGDPVDRPVNLYAATKRANELMAHAYSHLYGLPTTGLRFFTVYGPWGRPDMSLFIFIKAILNGRPIRVFNHGRMKRDFTYIDDIVTGVLRVLDKPATPDAGVDPASHPPPLDRSATAPFRIFNIGNGRPVPLTEYVAAIEAATGVAAYRLMEPMQAGDVPASHADTSALHAWVGFRPGTDVADGIAKCVAWARDYYGVRQ